MTRPILVADASVALKWFHSTGEEAVEAAREVLEAFADRRIDLVILDLTVYEIGNALSRRPEASPESVAVVLDALTEIRVPTAPTAAERADAARLGKDHRLTFYDAAYAAVARGRGARLVTMDRGLLTAGLGVRPEDALV